MPDLHYVTLQAIRVEAGMQNREVGKAPAGGNVDGANTDFFVDSTPIVDSNHDDLVNQTDVVAYVDGSAAPVSEIDNTTGLVRLTTAPAADTDVTLDYTWSPVDDVQVSELRDEGEAWLNKRVGRVIDISTLTADTFPREWRTIVKLWCAAMILIRDYGSSTDTDESSKDGYKKLGTAKKLLAEWLEEQGAETGTPAAQNVTVVSDGHIFERKSFDNGEPADPERRWWNHR